jgi:hypothetical protein
VERVTVPVADALMAMLTGLMPTLLMSGTAGGSVVVTAVVVDVVVAGFVVVVVGFFEVDVVGFGVRVGPWKAALVPDGTAPVVRGLEAPTGVEGGLDDREPLSSTTEMIPTTSTTTAATPNSTAGRNRRGSSSS